MGEHKKGKRRLPQTPGTDFGVIITALNSAEFIARVSV